MNQLFCFSFSNCVHIQLSHCCWDSESNPPPSLCPTYYKLRVTDSITNLPRVLLFLFTYINYLFFFLLIKRSHRQTTRNILVIKPPRSHHFLRHLSLSTINPLLIIPIPLLFPEFFSPSSIPHPRKNTTNIQNNSHEYIYNGPWSLRLLRQTLLLEGLRKPGCHR